jgi:hypothetical protein
VARPLHLAVALPSVPAAIALDRRGRTPGRDPRVELRGKPQIGGDAAHVARLVGHHEAHPGAARPRAAGTADAVDVAVAILRGVEVDHVRDLRHVDAAGGDVRRHERVHGPGFEARKRLLALGLGLVAVHRDGGEVLGPQALHEPVGSALGAHEDERAATTLVAKLAHERAELGVVGYVHEAVLDIGLPLRGRAVHVLARIARVGLRDLSRGALERGGEEERLALGGALGDDPVHRRLEAHVEHPVGLVEHEDADVLQREVAALEQVLEPARGGDDDVRARGQLGLALEPDAAVHDGYRERAGVGHGLQLVDDLAGELARRGEDERRGASRLRGDEVGDRYPERQGLAGPGGRLGKDVPPGEHVTDDELLDREGCVEAAGAEGGRDRF